MTDNISVPRDLLIDVRDSTNEAGNLSYRQHHIDHHRRLTRKLDELLEAPAVEVEGLEVVGYLLAKGRALSIWPANKDTDEPLCRLSEATAVIDQQAARIKELEKDAAIGEVVWRFIDRMGDHCEVDKAETILDQFVAAVTPHIMAALKGENHE